MSEEYHWRTGRSCIYKNYIHLVFVTKYRRDVLTLDMIERLREVFLETCLQMGAELLEFNGETDHVHLMVQCPPKLALANLVGKLKGKSSYCLRREFWPLVKNKLWGNRFWSPSYCAVSCGGAPLEIVKRYIEDQRRPVDRRHVHQSKVLTGRKRDQEGRWQPR